MQGLGMTKDRHVAQITRDAAAALRPRRGRSREVRPKAEPVAPTPERIAQASGGYSVSQDGQMRVVQAPLERMHARRQLNPDPEINEILYSAGRRFREDWMVSGLGGGGGGGIDPGRGGGGSGDPAWSMPATERAARARWDWRHARAAMPVDERTIVGCVVLDEMGIVEAGYVLTRGEVSGRRNRTLATDLLRDGLRTLARFYGLVGRWG